MLGKEHIIINIEASKLEHKFITTDRKDIVNEKII